MHEASYAHTRRLDGLSPAQAIAKVKEALATEGFGVLTEIDVQATLKAKLGVDRKPYVILGACNPQLAKRALELEPAIGVFMPCNVDVFEGEDGATYVQSGKAPEMFKVISNPSVQPIADEVDARIRRVLDKLA